MYLEEKIVKAKTLSYGTNMEEETKGGRSCTLMPRDQSQPKAKSTNNLDSMLRDHSILFPKCHHTDTLISLVETSSSKHQTVKRVRYSSSTKNQEPSNPNATMVGHLTSNPPDVIPTCKCGTPTQDGGNSSDIVDRTLSMLKARKFLMFLEERILKVKIVKSGQDIMDQTRDGKSFILTKWSKKKSRE